MGIDGITSFTDSYLQNIKDTANTSNITSTVSKDFSKATDEELMSVCKEFEAYFVEQMFKAMKKTIPENEEESATSEFDMFEDTLYQEYAKQTAESGQLGMAQMLFEQMKRNYDV